MAEIDNRQFEIERKGGTDEEQEESKHRRQEKAEPKPPNSERAGSR
jgi:hypothetical protein